MNGAAESALQQPLSSSDRLQAINEALRATLDPRQSNDVRNEALQHLEQVKTQPDAPQLGFLLAESIEQNNAVRYYGLQLLEYAVRYRWAEYNDSQTEQLRVWIKALAGNLREQDALFFRNKIAQVWAEAAKRCWAAEWNDMDSLLVELWDKPVAEKGMANKIFVLCVLEILSEDIVNSEDAVAGLRLEILGHALNEVMVPSLLYQELSNVKNGRQELRCGEEGWLARVCGFFSACVKQARMETTPELRSSMATSAVKALDTLRPTMAWINLKGAVEVNCIDCLFLPFHTDDVPLRTAATEVLYALLNRPYHQNSHQWWIGLYQQALLPDRIAMLRTSFDQNHTAPGEDDEKYTLQKKLSELISVLADGLASHPDLAEAGKTTDMPAFFDLLQTVLQSRSLAVSIPVLHSFTRLMAVQNSTMNDLVFQVFGTLVQTCSARLIKYESLGDDTGDEIAMYLSEDFDTIPERHAFLGNYRRYCVTIIQAITCSRPHEALTHVLGQIRTMLESGPYTGSRGFDSATYSKTGLAVLQFDAQFQVVTSALKGYSSWLAEVSSMAPEDESRPRAEADRSTVANSLQQWCYSMINTHTDDPEVAAQVFTILVTILQTIRPEHEFVLQIIQHLLTMRLYDNPAHTTFSDAVKSFEALRVVELQKLAMAFPNQLFEVYHELEPRIEVLAQKHRDDPRLLWGYRAFLFMIIHRAAGIEDSIRATRLRSMLDPVYQAWQNPALETTVTSLETFCDSLGMGSLAEFYKAYRFDQTSDWSSAQLNEEGQAKQADIKTKSDGLPLRMTKAMLSVATEKLKVGSSEYQISCALWAPLIPVVLQRLLQMLRHAQAFHNLNNWAHLPEELQAVVKRTLQDRFWQSGISNESKNEFYARITGSKTSFEGFASSVRGTMRTIREQGYHIIYLLGKFDDHFYGLSDLALPLSEALFADAGALSATHLHPIINLSTGMVQQCPPRYHAQFLPPLLIQLFGKLDHKISNEWDAIGHARDVNQEEDTLNDEMRTESVLRQLTFSMVSFVTFLLHYDRQRPQPNGHNSSRPSTLRDLVLSDPAVLEPLILFCTHALRMRDTRCCITICKVFRGMIPVFASDNDPAPQVREFVSTEVLKACITSLNEPYFADMQKDLAMLIAQIVLYYTPKTNTPKTILLSLPAMSASKVERTIGKICKSQSERQQRALVLDLLEGVRGVSIHEQGKIAKETKKPGKTKVQQHYMEVEQPPTITNGEENGLESVAALFGDS